MERCVMYITIELQELLSSLSANTLPYKHFWSNRRRPSKLPYMTFFQLLDWGHSSLDARMFCVDIEQDCDYCSLSELIVQSGVHGVWFQDSVYLAIKVVKS